MKIHFRLLIDISVFLVILISCILINTFQFTTQLGVYMNDENIKYPLKPSMDFNILMPIICVLPVIIIIISETSIQFLTDDLTNRFNKISILGRFQCKGHIIGSYIFSGIHLQAIVFTYFITEFCKYRVGRLRPNFLALCNLTNTSQLPSIGFVDNFNRFCLNSPETILNGRFSFPCPYSSCTVSAAVILILYLHFRLKKWIILKSPLILIYLTLIGLTIYVCTSRIIDYWNHPTDILVSVLIGLFVPVIFFYQYAVGYISTYTGYNSESLSFFDFSSRNQIDLN